MEGKAPRIYTNGDIGLHVRVTQPGKVSTGVIHSVNPDFVYVKIFCYGIMAVPHERIRPTSEVPSGD